LENAMSVIVYHRVAVRRRRFVVSALLPYVFIVFLGLGLLVVTVVAGKLVTLATHNITVFGVPHSLSDLSDYLLYLLGVAGEILILTAIYLVMPVGRLSLRHALIGGVTAGLLWELTRHLLGWYSGTMSEVRGVYGSVPSSPVRAAPRVSRRSSARRSTASSKRRAKVRRPARWIAAPFACWSGTFTSRVIPAGNAICRDSSRRVM